MSAAFTPGPWTRTVCRVEGDGQTICVADLMRRADYEDGAKEAEANARLIATAPKLYSDLERAVSFLRAAPLESGVCCCGSPVDGHGFGDGHSPVDELQYHAGGLADQFAETLAKARGEQSL